MTSDAHSIDWQVFIELTPDGYLLTTEAGTITAANVAVANLLRTDPHHLVGQSILPFVAPPEDNHGSVTTHLAALQEDGQLERVLLLRATDGNLLPTSVRVRRQSGIGLPAFHWLLRDLTSQQQVQAERERRLGGQLSRWHHAARRRRATHDDRFRWHEIETGVEGK